MIFAAGTSDTTRCSQRFRMQKAGQWKKERWGGNGNRRVRMEGRDRHVVAQSRRYTIGVLVQTNFGGDLTITGIPVGRE